MTGCLEVVLSFYVMDVTVCTVCLAHDLHLQFLSEVIQRVAHALHCRGLFKPLTHLLRVALHLLGKIAVDALVLLRRVVG